MTIREAIDRADALRPNTLPEREKRLWLAALDGMLRRQVVQTHAGAESAAGTGADKAETDDTVLLASEPDTGLYLYWLMAQIDLALAEITRYNNDMMLYNMALAEYSAAYKRSHAPLSGGGFIY